MGEQWTVRSLLQWARDWLGNKGVENPRLDAELLLARATGGGRLCLYVDHDMPPDPAELQRFKDLIRRRAGREPVAYILGAKEFYGRSFAVDSRVFIPRPETELLVQAALQALDPARGEERDPQTPRPLRALDLCAGSGAAGVTLAAEREGLCVDLAELSEGAAAAGAPDRAPDAPRRCGAAT